MVKLDSIRNTPKNQIAESDDPKIEPEINFNMPKCENIIKEDKKDMNAEEEPNKMMDIIDFDALCVGKMNNIVNFENCGGFHDSFCIDNYFNCDMSSGLDSLDNDLFMMNNNDHGLMK